MLLPKKLEPRYIEWNKKWGAPFGRRPANLRVHDLRGRMTAADEALLAETGMFSVQPTNDTRTIEYPWAYHAARLLTPMRILEVGGGLSGFQFVLSREGHAVDNVDPGLDRLGWPVSQDAMHTLNRVFSTNVSLLKCGIEEAKLPIGAYDRAFCLSVIEHLPLDEARRGLKIIHRALKPDGLLIVTLDLFLDLIPFSRRSKNQWGCNQVVTDLIDSSQFEIVQGNQRELLGFPEFDVQEVMGKLDQYFLGSFHPVLAQAMVLRPVGRNSGPVPSPKSSGSMLHFWLITDFSIDPQKSSSQTHVAQVIGALLKAGHRVSYGYLFGEQQHYAVSVINLANRPPN